ncbi:hypothetical protein ACB098_06G002100 [Castanea mollissima]
MFQSPKGFNTSATTNISTLNKKSPFTSNKKPKSDQGHGKWRGRERYILHLGKGERGMDTVTELGRLTGEDSGLVQCFDHALFFNHVVFFLGLVRCFDHRLWCHGASSLGMKNKVKMRRG